MTDTNNREKFWVGGEETELEASIGAMVLYEQEFKEGAEEPYTGDMLNDVFAESQAQAQGGLVISTWHNSPKALGMAWAMAHAAGSTKEAWPEFKERVEATVSTYECAYLVSQVYQGQFGRRTFFRDPERFPQAEEPDDAQA